MKILLVTLITCLMASCTAPKYGVGAARITITKKGLHIQPIEPLRRVNDTTMIVQLIQRIR